MGSGMRLGSRIYTNSFASKNNEMALPLMPKLYFGFPSKGQYSYNAYHQLADLGAGSTSDSRVARWNRQAGVVVSFKM